MGNHYRSASDYDTIRTEYELGTSLNTLADKHNISRSTLRNYANRHNWKQNRDFIRQTAIETVTNQNIQTIIDRQKRVKEEQYRRAIEIHEIAETKLKRAMQNEDYKLITALNQVIRGTSERIWQAAELPNTIKEKKLTLMTDDSGREKTIRTAIAEIKSESTVIDAELVDND